MFSHVPPPAELIVIVQYVMNNIYEINHDIWLTYWDLVCECNCKHCVKQQHDCFSWFLICQNWQTTCDKLTITPEHVSLAHALNTSCLSEVTWAIALPRGRNKSQWPHQTLKLGSWPSRLEFLTVGLVQLSLNYYVYAVSRSSCWYGNSLCPCAPHDPPSTVMDMSNIQPMRSFKTVK